MDIKIHNLARQFALLSMLMAIPTVTFSAQTVFLESGGQVVVEAENFSSRTPDATGKNWLVVPDENPGAGPRVANARGGKYIQSLPDNQTGGGPTVPPSIEYKVQINTTGLYRLFLRWDGNASNTDQSDTIFVDLVELKDGPGGTIADWYELIKFNFGNFSSTPWDGGGGFEQNLLSPDDGSIQWVINKPGIYTVRISQREDGAAADAFVLQLASLPAPSGNGPPQSEFTTGSFFVLPKAGGDTGNASVQLYRLDGFVEGTTVKLVKDGEPEIIGTSVSIEDTGTTLETTFDLAGMKQGSWDVVVTNPDGTSSIFPQGFTIEAGRPAEVWVNVVGLNVIRPGRAQTFQIFYGNRGNVDAKGAFISVDFPTILSWKVGDDQPLASISSTANGSVLTFAVSEISAGNVGVLQFVATVPNDQTLVGQKFSIRVRKLPFDSPALTATQQGYFPLRNLFFGEPHLFEGCSPPDRLPRSCPTCDSALADFGARLDLTNATLETYWAANGAWLVALEKLAFDMAQGVAATSAMTILAPLVVEAAGVTGVTAAAAWQSAVSLYIGTANDLFIGSLSRDPLTIQRAADNALRAKTEVEIANLRILNSAGYVINRKLIEYFEKFLFKLDLVVGLAQTVINDWDDLKDVLARVNEERNALNEQNWYLCRATDAYISCANSSCSADPSNTPVNPEPGDPGTDADDSGQNVGIVGSFDPNDKVGSQGTGNLNYLFGGKPLPYSIFFENLETASASAQEVVVTDQLDITKLDLSTLSLGPIIFGDKVIPLPQGLTKYTAGVDLRPEKNLLVRINADYDSTTNILSWRFTSIDPATGKLTTNPLEGFLPPNTDSVAPKGSGSVLFTVMPKSGLPTGTEIRNKASIVFDTNAPIETPEWLNTIDNAKPESQVLTLPATQTSTSFKVEWSGNDVGAGVKDYSIFVSENGGTYNPWLTNVADTSGIFTGNFGKIYSFYGVARDLTGNIEDVPVGPDTTTQLVAILKPGDLNGDGYVTCADMAIVKASFGKRTGQAGFDLRADVNKDGIVDIRDLSFVSRLLPAGTKCS